MTSHNRSYLFTGVSKSHSLLRCHGSGLQPVNSGCGLLHLLLLVLSISSPCASANPGIEIFLYPHFDLGVRYRLCTLESDGREELLMQGRGLNILG